MMIKKDFYIGLFSVFFVALITHERSFANEITVGVLTSSGVQRSMYATFEKEFEAANPDIQLTILIRSDAEYKEEMKTWFAKGVGPDILNWQGGERLYQYVRENKIKDISHIWAKNDLGAVFSDAAKGAVSYENNRYAIPISYYQWGFYYRQSLFDYHGLSAPTTWDEFLAVCAKLKAAGVTPITIGAQYKWPTAAWFDYLNLRINGLEFHQQLLKGEISYTDSRVEGVFKQWKILLDKGYFVDRHNGWNWQQAMPFMYHKLAGMTLIGNFFAGTLPQALKDDFRFFRFPIIDPSLDVYEEAPLDLFMVPSYAKENTAIEKFLLFLASKGFQQKFNETLGMISTNLSTDVSDDYFIQMGTKTLNASAGVSQFFDRDANAGMSSAAMEIFTEFLDSKNVNVTLKKLEDARKIHY
jgi:multiple sugar transport system substrate-binding protein